MTIISLRLAAAIAVALAAVGSFRGTSAAEVASRPRAVIAVVENNGVNVLHDDFRVAPGDRVVLPPGFPGVRWLSLPETGSFDERLQLARQGTLGNLQPGQLYWIKGTRVGIFIPPGSNVRDIFADREHGTGSASSAIGSRHGTNPDGLVVVVPDASVAAWSWLVKQQWIDIVSTSYYGIQADTQERRPTCPAARFITKIVEQGRMVFSSSGNVEHVGAAFAPSGVPAAYQVGGVDDVGRTYVPTSPGTSLAVTPTRPYETGDRFDFLAADPDSLAGSARFGGTSGATPSTAGRAADVLESARGLTGSMWTGVRDGAVAVGPRSARPPMGPLRDGRLEADELMRLLHHVAIPAEPQSPVRYLIEGFGALNDDAVVHAKSVVAGTAAEPDRRDEDRLHEVVETLRSALFSEVRCG